MLVWFICGYRSDKAKHVRELMTDEYWDAYWYSWAVKVGRHKRDFYIGKRDRGIRITKENFHRVRSIFGQFITEKIADESPGLFPLIVPVPSKDALANAIEFRSLTMAREAMAGTPHQQNVFGAVRWREARPKAHEGGRRGRDSVKPYLFVAGDVRGQDVVLVDDILSTGSHLLACGDMLREAGANVLGAVVCGRTIYDAGTKAFGKQSYDLTEEIFELGRQAFPPN